MAVAVAWATGLSVVLTLVGFDLLRSDRRSMLLRLASEVATAANGGKRGAWIRGVGHTVASWVSPASRERVADRLVWAGEPMTPEEFLGVRAVLAAALLVIGLTLRSTGTPTVIALALGAVGYLAPQAWLTRRVEARQREVRRAEPLLSDLLATALAAGMELNPALERIIPYIGGPLGEELSRAWRQILTGMPRAAALQGVAKRTGVDTIESLVRTIITAEQYGTPVAKAIREHAQSVRQMRRHRAEAQARAATSKMLWVTIVFLFVPLMLLLFLPGVVLMARIFPG